MPNPEPFLWNAHLLVTLLLLRSTFQSCGQHSTLSSSVIPLSARISIWRLVQQLSPLIIPGTKHCTKWHNPADSIFEEGYMWEKQAFDHRGKILFTPFVEDVSCAKEYQNIHFELYEFEVLRQHELNTCQLPSLCMNGVRSLLSHHLSNRYCEVFQNWKSGLNVKCHHT